LTTANTSESPLLGVVLAGGKSRRMGQDKAQLMWRGRFLIDHAIARFREAGVTNVAVSGDRPAYGGIGDLHPGEGPLAGLLTIASAHPSRRLLIVPVDMPRFPASLIAQLATREPDAAALHFPNAPMPLRIDASSALISLLSAWLDDPTGPRAVRLLLREVNASTLTFAAMPTNAFDNANTPADWARIS
jgi:molybdenum cofactor guanylyltransferase